MEFLDQNNLAASDKNYRSEIFSLRGNEEVKREIPLFCAKRGYYSIDQIDFIGNDLFYTKRFLSSQQVNSNICILPGKADAKQLMVATQKMTGETVVPRSDCDDPFTFRGIRQYQNFDSIRDINWKASAKTGDLRVNIHDFTADQEVVILLDSEWDALLKPDSLLEESIRIAASISDELIGKGIMTSLITNGRDCISNQVTQIPAGAHSQHSHSIQYALARLKIQNEVAVPSLPALLQDQIERMDAQPNRKLSWVLISTQTNQQVIAAWKELRQRAVKSYWISQLTHAVSFQKKCSLIQILSTGRLRMENNFFFQFWVSRSLRDFHVVLSVVAVCSQVIGAVSGNQNISSFGDIIALFTILHFFLHGYFYRQQNF